MERYLIDLTKYNSDDTIECLLKKENIKQYYYCKYNFRTTQGENLKIYDSKNYDGWKNNKICNEIQFEKVVLHVIPQLGN
jgi:hypothetical protein